MKTLFINGNIHTMDADIPHCQALAVENESISAIGTSEEILALRQPEDTVIDLCGKAMIPGFIDSHMHVLGLAEYEQNVQLSDCRSIEEILAKTEAFQKAHQIPDGKWIMGRGWNQDYFDVPRFPTREDLDKVCPDHPMVMVRACGHALVCNTKALEIAGITGAAPQVDGGSFALGTDGEPNGIFTEAAMDLVRSHIPAPTVEELKTGILAAQKALLKAGITSVHTDDFSRAGSPDAYENVITAYQQLEHEGLLKLRINEQCNLSEEKYLRDFLAKGYHKQEGSHRFRLGPLKIIADGSLGARTAFLRQPYADDPSTCGISYYSKEDLHSYIQLAHENGMQIVIHCIGDGIMEWSMDGLENAMNAVPREDCRHGIVHCQITDMPLLRRFKELQLLALIQPIFLHYDMHIVEDRVGKALASTSYNWKSLLDLQVHSAFGTDCPVENYDPANNLYCAVTRKDLSGSPEDGFQPEQKLSVDEALHGYTVEGAYASFEENFKGRLIPGMAADMAVLSDDPYTCKPEMLKELRAVMTISGGEIVYQDNAF